MSIGHIRGNIGLAALAELMGHPLRRGETGVVEGITIHEHPKLRPTQTFASEPQRQPAKVDPHKHTRQTERYLRQQARRAEKIARKMRLAQAGHPW